MIQNTLPTRRVILVSRYFGRVGFMLTRKNVDGVYGKLGSRGREYSVTVWRNPR